jgi:Phosphate-induced protein 1 conserved region
MCGWHGSAQYFNFGGADIKFGFIGNSDRCRNLCVPTPNQLSSPNSNIGGDAMANHIAHEIEEAVNDPDGDAWYDASGYESADKCAGKYGTTFSVNGATANIALNGTYYLIQQNWANAAGGYCALSY